MPAGHDARVLLLPMSLALLGLLTIVSVLAAILSRRVTPLVALIALPVAAALAGGFAGSFGAFAMDGLRRHPGDDAGGTAHRGAACVTCAGAAGPKSLC